MKKAVIFDMDGLLIDSEMYCYLGWKDFFKEQFHADLSLEEYGQFLAGKNPRGSIDLVNDYYHIHCTVEDIEEHFKRRNKDHIIHPLKKGAVELVKYCYDHGIKTVIASSSNKERIVEQVKPSGILNLFDEIVSGREVARGKPYPDIFLKACKQVNVEVKDAVVLEDSEAGLKAAIDGNIDAIWIPDIAQPSKEVIAQCKAVLPSLEQVIQYIEED